MKHTKKPKIAFFDFACCEGCQLHVLELEERLLSLLQHVEVVAWREVMSGAQEDCDIAFCEGSIANEEDLLRIRRIRERTGTMVALGSCASLGCHNALKNELSMREAIDIVYEKGRAMDTIPARPVSDVVTVDYQVLGCPVSLPEFESVFKRILLGQDHTPPSQPVCVECKHNDYLCVYEKGLFCLGPVTRCGCNAICTAYGEPCYGCRGLVDDANLRAAVRVLTREQLHGIMREVTRRHRFTEAEIRKKFGIYNSPAGGTVS
ncbi:MAG: hypothetical protein K9N10_15525 [Deltaproteobacteria bacterium]|nr:hypothetical protein [Deltaproteobacteria bacterium]